MVFTPLHYPQAYLLYKCCRERLSYPGLLIGSFLPDLEVPVLVMLGYEIDYARLVLHSIIGSILFSWIIGLALLPIYRFILRMLLGQNIEIDIMKYILSVELGSIIHVLIDAMHHKYNPLLWPIMNQNIAILIPFGAQEETHIILHIVFLILTIICIIDIIKYNINSTPKIILKKIIYDPIK